MQVRTNLQRGFLALEGYRRTIPRSRPWATTYFRMTSTFTNLVISTIRGPRKGQNQMTHVEEWVLAMGSQNSIHKRPNWNATLWHLMISCQLAMLWGIKDGLWQRKNGTNRIQFSTSWFFEPSSSRIDRLGFIGTARVIYKCIALLYKSVQISHYIRPRKSGLNVDLLNSSLKGAIEAHW